MMTNMRPSIGFHRLTHDLRKYDSLKKGTDGKFIGSAALHARTEQDSCPESCPAFFSLLFDVALCFWFRSCILLS